MQCWTHLNIAMQGTMIPTSITTRTVIFFSAIAMQRLPASHLQMHELESRFGLNFCTFMPLFGKISCIGESLLTVSGCIYYHTCNNMLQHAATCCNMLQTTLYKFTHARELPSTIPHQPHFHYVIPLTEATYRVYYLNVTINCADLI